MNLKITPNLSPAAGSSRRNLDPVHDPEAELLRVQTDVNATDEARLTARVGDQVSEVITTLGHYKPMKADLQDVLRVLEKRLAATETLALLASTNCSGGPASSVLARLGTVFMAHYHGAENDWRNSALAGQMIVEETAKAATDPKVKEIASRVAGQVSMETHPDYFQYRHHVDDTSQEIYRQRVDTLSSTFKAIEELGLGKGRDGDEAPWKQDLPEIWNMAK